VGRGGGGSGSGSGSGRERRVSGRRGEAALQGGDVLGQMRDVGFALGEGGG